MSVYTQPQAPALEYYERMDSGSADPARREMRCIGIMCRFPAWIRHRRRKPVRAIT